MRALIEVAGVPHEVTLTKDGTRWQVDVDGDTFTVGLERNGAGTLLRVGDRVLHVDLVAPGQACVDGHATTYRIHEVTGTAAPDAAGQARATPVRPPMNGKLDRLVVQLGQVVAKGEVLFILEAMKMHNEVKAPVAGRVAAIHLQAGETVEPRQVVLDLEPA